MFPAGDQETGRARDPRPWQRARPWDIVAGTGRRAGDPERRPAWPCTDPDPERLISIRGCGRFGRLHHLAAHCIPGRQPGRRSRQFQHRARQPRRLRPRRLTRAEPVYHPGGWAGQSHRVDRPDDGPGRGVRSGGRGDVAIPVGGPLGRRNSRARCDGWSSCRLSHADERGHPAGVLPGCVVLPLEDSLASIFKTLGRPPSCIRPAAAPVLVLPCAAAWRRGGQHQGIASGPASFLAVSTPPRAFWPGRAAPRRPDGRAGYLHCRDGSRPPAGAGRCR